MRESMKYDTNIYQLRESVLKRMIQIIQQQRYIEDKNIRAKFIDESFSYLEKNIPNYKSNVYFKQRNMLKSFIEKNKCLSKLYCSLYNLKRVMVKNNEKN